MREARSWRRARPYLWALVACLATAGLCFPFAPYIAPTNIAMLFLLTVVLVATYSGRGPAVLASFLGVAIFDVVFVPPRWSFAVSDLQYLLTFAVMLGVALLIAALTAGLKHQAELTAGRERDARGLYETARELAGAMSKGQIALVISRAIDRLLEIEVCMFIADEEERLQPILEDNDTVSTAAVIPSWIDRSIVYAVHRQTRRAGLEGPSTGNPRVHYLPMQASMRTRGVLVARGDLSSAQDALLEALVSLSAIAAERLHFVEIAQRTETKMESERLRHALLAAVSHDLRTPLTALVGLADTLVLPSAGLSDAAQSTASIIRDQARRLSTMVSNVLDMAKLQAGHTTLRREWQPIDEVIGTSLEQLTPELAGREVHLTLEPGLPLLDIDAVLMERVFYNLVENAAKYSPSGSAISIEAARIDGYVRVAVVNAGTQIVAADTLRIFDLFERASTESAIHGTGLGLTICRNIIAAHGGVLRLAEQDGDTTRFEFTLPLGEPPSIAPAFSPSPEDRPDTASTAGNPPPAITPASHPAPASVDPPPCPHTPGNRSK